MTDCERFTKFTNLSKFLILGKVLSNHSVKFSISRIFSLEKLIKILISEFRALTNKCFLDEIRITVSDSAVFSVVNNFEKEGKFFANTSIVAEHLGMRGRARYLWIKCKFDRCTWIYMYLYYMYMYCL